MDEANAHKLFFAVSFTIIPGDGFPQAEQDQLRRDLEAHGAIFVPLKEDSSVDDVAQHSHIISKHVDFPEYNNALDANSHVVKPSWVYQSIAKGRQAQTRQHSPDPALFFQDVVITCADLPSGDKDAITAGVMAMGGMYSSPLTKLVTHIVTLTEEHPKVEMAREKGLDCRIVLPHWFDDCLKLGRKITEKPYVLPNPSILSRENGPARVEATPDVEGATSAVAGQPPRLTPPPSSMPTPATPRRTLNAFAGKKVLFSKDLNINDRLARTLASLVHRGGGSLTMSVDECDIYIGHYRDGSDYVTASQAHKVVANLPWFYNVITRNRWTNPTTKLMHYPVPRHGIDGFQDMIISLSNYTGEARLYLENLIKEAGAEYTRTMKQDNTHLITAHKVSEKCDAAQEWNIHIINHLWLEESYAKCAVQSLTQPRYTHFPQQTNLGEIVGQTQIDLDKVEQHYFKEKPRTIADVERTGVPEDVPHPSTGAVKPPKPRKKAPVEENEEITKPTNVPVANNSAVDEAAEAHTPIAVRNGSEKENVPPLPGSRSSKQRANDKIHAAAGDIALFQKEMKRKGGVLHGKKRASAEPDESVEDATGSLNGDQAGAADGKKKTKKARTDDSARSVLPDVQFRMLVTGEERWRQNLPKETKDRNTLRSLGIDLVNDPDECNLLCAPRLLRTRKFLAALAVAPEVVSTEYLDYALQRNQLHDTCQFPLLDRDGEERFGIRLRDTLDRAKTNQRRLLRGWTIYVTERISSGYDTFANLIDMNGGTAIAYRGRTGIVLPKKRKSRTEDDEGRGPEAENQGGEEEETDFVYLVSSTADEEVKTWATFRKTAEKQGRKPRIVKTDWLLNLCMDQRVSWDGKWELSEDTVPGWVGGKK